MKKRVCFRKRMSSIIAALITFAMILALTSCGTIFGKFEDTRETILVSDVFELFDAIKSDIIVKLMPGDYDISEYSTAIANAEIKASPYISNDNYGEGISITGVENCKIYANDSVLLYTSNPLADVLTINESSDMSFQNISFGHKIPTGECEGGVISMDGCTGISFEDDDFFGCGTIGFFISNSSDISIIDSKIHDCLYRAMDFYEASNILLLRSQINNIGKRFAGNLFLITSSEDINLKSCKIFDNGNMDNIGYLEDMFFNTDGEKVVSMSDCTLTNNLYADADTVSEDVSSPEITPISTQASEPQSANSSSTDSLEIGDAFKLFSTVDLFGNPMDHTVFADNKLTMVNVWATWCGPCVAEIPELGKIAKDYADQGVAVIGVLADSIMDNNLTRDEGSITAGIDILRESNAKYINLIPDKSLNNFIMELEYYPTTFFVDHTGTILYEKVGSNNYESWAAEIERLLEEVT